MENGCRVLIPILVIQLLAVLCASSQDFDFFYFVQQWPGSYCDTRRSCCYPTTGKPDADFGIHGLWPNYDDGSYPSNCDSSTRFVASEISDLTSSLQKYWPTLACPTSNGLKFWSHEWLKHGTCAESVFDQHGYFEAALNLKKQVNLLQALENAGIKPDGRFYSVEKIKEAIKEATGFTPGIECNVDSSRNHQLYQVYLCVDTSGTNFIECPIASSSRCYGKIEFPSFGSHGREDFLDHEEL
ncbi:ribonuclease 1-like [Macadamia integrifolia]|uniref:ribonuclease 1-like n=1 Tax=Macadamia integrifolia TaxID=60698 RepID=UPI001C50097D|nr:ribonuclease 1-like [Macadamia integrifolia]